MFFKTEYRGLVFVKCASVEAKNKLSASIQAAAKSLNQTGDKRLFAKDDLPMDIRIHVCSLGRLQRMLLIFVVVPIVINL